MRLLRGPDSGSYTSRPRGLHPLYLEAPLEPLDDLAVQAAIGATRGLDESIAQLEGHAKEESETLSGQVDAEDYVFWPSRAAADINRLISPWL
jgi:hypothetical protein